MFAQSPVVFADCGDVVSIQFPSFYRKPWSVTNWGLAIDLDVRKETSSLIGGSIRDIPPFEFAPLHCAHSRTMESPIYIRLRRNSRDDMVRWGHGGVSYGMETFIENMVRDRQYERRTIYFRQVCTLTAPNAPVSSTNPDIQSFVIISPSLRKSGFWVSGTHLPDPYLTLWDERRWIITLAYGFGALMFSNNQGVRFLLILRAKRDFPSLDVMVQKDDLKFKNFKGSLMWPVFGQPGEWVDSGAVQFFGPLHGRHFLLSVALRKGLTPGEKHYFVDANIEELPTY